MKRIRYIIIALLFTVGFLFNGELFALYMDNFQESFYQSTFSFENTENDISDKEIINDFNRASEESHVDFFMIDSKIESAYRKTINIYGTEEAIKVIEGKGIHRKTYLSMFLGTIEVNLLPFNEIKNIKRIEYCYYIGDANALKDMRAFKASLVDKYGGGFPKIYASDKETRMNVIAVWSIIIFLISILHLYEVVLQKKEVALRVVLGEDIKSIFIKNLIGDFIFILACSVVVPPLLVNYTNTIFMYSLAAKLIGVALLLNFAINRNVFKLNFRKHLVRSYSSGKLSVVNYAVKSLITVLVIMMVSSNIILIVNGINYFKQQAFFNDLKDYSYYRLGYKNENNKKTMEDQDLMNQAFYNQFVNSSVMSVNLTRNFKAKYPVVLLNENALKNLEKKYPELSKILDMAKEEGQYMIKPDHIKVSSEAFLTAKLNLDHGNDLDKEEPTKVFSYKSEVEVVGIIYVGQFESKILKNPIIIYNNELYRNDLAESLNLYPYSIMYDIENKEFQQFIKANELEGQFESVSNVKEVYEYNYAIAMRSMKLNFVIAAFLLILEISMISIIIRMEFSCNAIEIVLKKIYGYTFFDRHRKLFIVTTISIMASGLIILVFSKMVNLNGLKYILFVLPALLIAELSMIYLKALSVENKNISTVLKGERI